MELTFREYDHGISAWIGEPEKNGFYFGKCYKEVKDSWYTVQTVFFEKELYATIDGAKKWLSGQFEELKTAINKQSQHEVKN